ncbi:hypothetical protein QBC37DRAFT_387754 [Rhypophila decipiens]|uniref:Uncharacterized protein n=1 Tax=Rhypophila decipiens TaxID=261697 RepID=A0AAN6Y9C5_9PEZI|nr:hypothetical protein QBC37DRAFT_387754 [Rhypophila decipiens]
MGRWGQRLFECDQDLEIPDELDIEFMSIDHPDAFDHRQSLLPKTHQGAIRTRLNNGVGKQVFSKLCAEEDHPKNYLLGEGGGRYRVIILGALMMRLGARIDKGDIEHLRNIATGSLVPRGLPDSRTGRRIPRPWEAPISCRLEALQARKAP